MLTVRSWMYHVFYLAAAVATVGLVRVWRKPHVLWLLGIYAAFWAGELYHVLLLFATRGVATSMGYYLCAVVGAEVPLAVAAFRRWAAAAFAVLFAALDLYTVHAVDIPYYTGMIRHKANGAIAAVHAADWSAVGFGGAFHRLAEFKSPLVSGPVLIVLWVAYLAATLLLVYLCLRRTVPSS
jgi:hypothetical protein